MIQIPDDLSICKDITHNKIKLLCWAIYKKTIHFTELIYP